jgi:hypothetical protein
MEYWNTGIVELWNIGIMEGWKYGPLEKWNSDLPGFKGLWAVKPGRSDGPEYEMLLVTAEAFQDEWNPACRLKGMEHWNIGIMEGWNIGLIAFVLVRRNSA